MKYLIGLLLIAMVALTACSSMSIKDVLANKEKLVGEEIKVTGIVENTAKLGPLSGYSLKDEKSESKIVVSSESLPKEGDKVTVKGVWMKDTLFGYYLKAE